MGIAERRERERGELRDKIVEAARDIVAEDGLDAISMRAIGERIEYSPGTIYLHFRDKDELLREIVTVANKLLAKTAREELAKLSPDAEPLDQYRAMGRAYARFALDHTAFFRALFRLPAVASMECPEPTGEDAVMAEENVVASIQRAVDSGDIRVPDARRASMIGWALIHGLTSLYISGQFGEDVASRADFEALTEEAMDALRHGWAVEPAETRADRVA